MLIDYNAYWIESLYDYVLYTGDLAVLRQVWPNLVRLVDELYPAHVDDGLLVNWLGVADYAYIPRGGTTVAYYNAQYVRALRLAASLAGWNGDAARAERWRGRAAEHRRGVPGRVLGRGRRRLQRHGRRRRAARRSTATRSRSWPGSRRRRRRSRCSRTSTARCKRSYGNSVADGERLARR